MMPNVVHGVPNAKRKAQDAKRRTVWVVRPASYAVRQTLNAPSLGARGEAAGGEGWGGVFHHGPRATGHRPRAFCFWLPAIGHRLSAIGDFRGGIFALVVAVVAHVLATSQAQSLTVGLFAAPGYISPTLEGSLELGGFSLSARLKRDSLGLGVEDDLEFGPAGRFVFGARGDLGFGLQPLAWGAEAYLRGSVAQFGLDARLGYASAPRAAMWAGERNFSGFAGNFNASYRLDPANTLRASLAYAGDVPGAIFQGSTLGLEGSWALREGGATYLAGLGFRVGAYALLGWRGELGEEGTLLDATLRLGWVNRLELGLFQEELRLRLMTTFPLGGVPFEAAASLEAESLRGDVAYDNANGRWTVWLRYTFTFD